MNHSKIVISPIQFWLMAFIVIVGFILFGNVESIELGGYHGWRKTQTMAAYDCFVNSQSISQELKCFIAPPLGLFNEKGNMLHFTKLEIPWMQFFHSSISLETHTNIFNLFMFWVLLITFTYAASIAGLKIAQSLGLLILLFFGLTSSPNYIFLIKGYAPDILATTLVVISLALYYLNISRLFIYILLAMTISVRPQLALLIALIVFYIQYPNLGIGFKLKEFLNLKKILVAVTWFLVILTPFMVIYFFGDSLLSGVMPYPHSLTGNLGSFSEFKYLFEDRLISNGALFNGLVILLALMSLKVAPYQIISIVLAYISTFFVFYSGFKVNTYYGVVSLPFLLTILFISIVALQKDRTFNRGGVFLVGMLVVFVFGSFFRPVAGTNQSFLMFNESQCSMGNLQKASKIISSNHINSVDVLNPQISYFMKGMNYRIDTLSTEEAVEDFFEGHKNSSVVSCGYYAKLIKSNLPLSSWIEDHFKSVYYDDVWVMVPKD